MLAIPSTVEIEARGPAGNRGLSWRRGGWRCVGLGQVLGVEHGVNWDGGEGVPWWEVRGRTQAARSASRAQASERFATAAVQSSCALVFARPQ